MPDQENEITIGLPKSDKKCSPALVTFNTLEGRPYTSDFDKAIQAPLRDPLWMISRQHQWGAFDGEEGGSIVFSKLSLKNTKINRFARGLETYKPYDHSIPMEMQIEHEAVPKTLINRIEWGRHWIKMLHHHFNAAGIIPNIYDQDYLSAFPIEVPVLQDPLDNEEVVAYALASSDADTMQMYHAAQGRIVDGIALWDTIKNGNVGNAILNAGWPQADQAAVEAAAIDYLAWIERTYNISLNKNQRSWSPSHLDYKVACAGPDAADAAAQFELVADDYNGRTLDWYSFDFKETEIDDEAGATFDEQVTSHDVTTRIPSKFNFKGIPRSRWWEMEEESIDFGGIDINSTDVSKVLLQDFMINASEDWYMVPYQAEIGSLLDLEGIELKDVFGYRTLVESANKTSQAGWERWSFLTQENRDDPSQVDTRLLLLPTSPKHLKSSPIEQVVFIRDEGANMVFAIEKIVIDELGKGKDGQEMSLALSNLVKELVTTSAPPVLIDNDAKIKYLLVTDLPEHWIPFIPNHVPGATFRAVRLQRAAMPRTELAGGQPVVRPRTGILQEGLNMDTTPITQDDPYYINEEEVTKAGTQVSKYYQRFRWLNGKVFLSLGRDRRVGRGGGASGLKFDQIEFKDEGT